MLIYAQVCSFMFLSVYNLFLLSGSGALRDIFFLFLPALQVGVVLCSCWCSPPPSPPLILVVIITARTTTTTTATTTATGRLTEFNRFGKSAGWSC